MLGFLVAVRNFLILVILGWLGFSEQPKDNNGPEESISITSVTGLIR